MGYTTDIIGTATITPGLNEAEADYLGAFAQSRRWDRPEGPYFVPPHPLLDGPPSGPRSLVDRFNHVAPDQPNLWCQWVPTPGGCCLAFDGSEKFYRPAEWLRYLIEHFLRAGARAQRSGDPRFEDFTFDHRVDGLFAARRRDDCSLWLIAAKENRVSERTLVRGATDTQHFAVLPYEKEIDSWIEDRSGCRIAQCAPVILRPGQAAGDRPAEGSPESG